MKLNERLKAFREIQRFSQREIAEIMGVSVATIQKYEYGTLKIKPDFILRLCKIFNVSFDEFFNIVSLTEDEKKEFSNLDELAKISEMYTAHLNQNIEVVNFILKNKNITENKKFLLRTLAFFDEFYFDIPKHKNILEIGIEVKDEFSSTLIPLKEIHVLLDILENELKMALLNFIKLSKTSLFDDDMKIVEKQELKK